MRSAIPRAGSFSNDCERGRVPSENSPTVWTLAGQPYPSTSRFCRTRVSSWRVPKEPDAYTQSIPADSKRCAHGLTDSGVRHCSHSRRRPNEKPSARGNDRERKDAGQQHRSEQCQENSERRRTAGRRVACVYTEDGHVVAARKLQDRKGQCGGRSDRAAGRRSLVRARRRWKHV
jgi:hypothetical protein